MSDDRDQWPYPPPLPGIVPPLWFVCGLGSILVLLAIGLMVIIAGEMLSVPLCG